MNKLRHYSFAVLLISTTLFFNACKKDSPIPEVPGEEVGKAELTFLEVEREAHGDHYHYNPIAAAKPVTIAFDSKGLAPVGAHLHLTEGKTYQLVLKSFDFANREMQQEFLNKHEIHQAFILGAPTGVLTYVYADRDKDNKKINVGVTGYVTVDKASDSFTFRYILRHLNPGVKVSITAQDWNTKDFASKFSGANDLDLKFELHPVQGEGHSH